MTKYLGKKNVENILEGTRIDKKVSIFEHGLRNFAYFFHLINFKILRTIFNDLNANKICKRVEYCGIS